MKILFNLLFLLLLSNQLSAQTAAVTKPQFPGGDKALVEYLNKSIIYPLQALKQRLSGTTLIGFIINEDGTIANIHVKKSSFGLLDNEAVRIVKKMPNWIPATENGVNKKELVVLPVTFDLKNKNYLFE